jgi:hypothetical protein
MSQSSDNYHAWVLRFWRENPQGSWRIALESVSTGERQGFSDLESLFRHLQTHFIFDQPIIKENPTDA